MNEIVTSTRRKLSHKPHLLESMHRLRHEVFYEKLGWQVRSVNGLEIDHYDDLDPTYMLSAASDGHVEGTWRLLPTQGPYMLKDIFPQLLRGEKAPESEKIWEISRFAVSSRTDHSRKQANLNTISLEMMRAAYLFAIEHGIQHYVFATSVSLERIFRSIGMPIHRFGDQKAQRIGKVLSVGCWIDINRQLHQALFERASASETMEEAV